MIDKSESVNWPNVWWILGADHLTFERVMGDFWKKCPAGWFWEGKNVQINSWEKHPTLKKISLMMYNAEKNLTPLYLTEKISNSRDVWEKILKLNQQNHPYPTPPQMSNGHVNHLGGEGWNRVDTLVNVIHQQNGLCVFIMWWFSRLKFFTSSLKIRR